MIPGMPALGVRFDIGKLRSGAYGAAAWKLFWSAVGIAELTPGTLLFEGDTSATLSGNENVYCIALQSTDRAAFGSVRVALERNEEFKTVASSPEFILDEQVTRQPLPAAGRIDAAGALVGASWHAGAGLKAGRND
jgi:hypothetical protein